MEKPFLFDTVDFLYHSVMDQMPKYLQDRDMASAFALGAAGTYGVVRGIQAASRKFAPDLDKRFFLGLEALSTLGMSVAPLLYAFFDPDGAREIMTMHPTYTSGMAGVYMGSITAGLQDINKRLKTPMLEDRLY